MLTRSSTMSRDAATNYSTTVHLLTSQYPVGYMLAQYES